jgi:hypothetical protein
MASLDGESVAQTAERLNKTPKSIEHQRARAREKLTEFQTPNQLSDDEIMASASQKEGVAS